MSKPTTLSVVVTQELKDSLEKWAAAEDRTVSATLRQILLREAERRGEARQRPQLTAKQAN